MRYQGVTLWEWYYTIRHLVRRVWSFFVRGYYGVAPMDTWSLDRYVFKTLAKGMRQLAKNPHGCPMFIIEEYGLDTDLDGNPADIEHAVECWQDWLIDKAQWLEWYVADDIGLTEEMSEEQRLAVINAYDRRYSTFKGIVLPNITRNIDALWD